MTRQRAWLFAGAVTALLVFLVFTAGVSSGQFGIGADDDTSSPSRLPQQLVDGEPAPDQPSEGDHDDGDEDREGAEEREDREHDEDEEHDGEGEHDEDDD